MSKTHRIMFITRPDNWIKLVEHFNYWPVKNNDIRTVKNQLNIGDEVLVYLSKKSALVGILKVTGELTKLDAPISIDRIKYEYMLPIHYKMILSEEEIIPLKPYIADLDLTKKRQDNWGVVLQKGMVRLSNNDFNYLINETKKSRKLG